MQEADADAPALQASLRTTGAEAPVQVTEVAPVVWSDVSVPTVAPDAFLRVKAPPPKKDVRDPVIDQQVVVAFFTVDVRLREASTVLIIFTPFE